MKKDRLWELAWIGVVSAIVSAAATGAKAQDTPAGPAAAPTVVSTHGVPAEAALANRSLIVSHPESA